MDLPKPTTNNEQQTTAFATEATETTESGTTWKG
jgi:hypothetical protein